MKFPILFTIALAALSACQELPTSSNAGTEITLECNQGDLLKGQLFSDHATLTIDGNTEKLQPVVTASGAKYANANVNLWIKGSEATIVKASQPNRPITCNIH